MAAEELRLLELVLVHGPPCSGKTRHLLEHYGGTHVRVCPREIYARHPNMSLHRLVGRVVRQLEQGKSVVVDDESRLARTRRSFIEAVQDKAARIGGVVQFIALEFSPSGGKQQALWAHEWALAEASAAAVARHRSGGNAPVHSRPRASSEFVEWFDMRDSEPPRREEGIMRVSSATLPLLALTEDGGKFKKPCLFIDGSCLFTFSHCTSGDENGEEKVRHHLEERHAGLAVPAVLQKWALENAAAKVVFLLDETSFYPMALEMEPVATRGSVVQHFRRQLHRYLATWACASGVALHCVVAEYGLHPEDSFFRLPHPGMVAWTQRRLEVSLAHSCVVSDPSSARAFLCSAGIPSVALAVDFFRDSSWSIESKVRKHAIDFSSKVPAFLCTIRYAKRDAVPDWADPPGKLLELEPSGRVVLGSGQETLLFEEQSGAGRLHWIFASDAARQQVLSDDHCEAPPSVSSELTHTSPPRAMNSTAVALSPKAKMPGELRRFDIEQIFGRSVVERGEPYLSHHTLFLRQRSGTRLSASCKGSSNPPYHMHAVVTPLGSLTSSRCSCPVGKEGRCKHLAAMLLSWLQEPSAFSPLGDQSENPFLPKPSPIEFKEAGDEEEELLAVLDEVERLHSSPSPRIPPMLPVQGCLSGGKRSQQGDAGAPRAGKQRASPSEGIPKSADLAFLDSLDRELDELDEDGDLPML